MKLSPVRIVLVATSHPGNIGASARAMKTMGLDSLYLVSPKSFPDLRAHEMAAGADDILQTCQVVPSLREALKGCHLVIGTSARPRGLSLPGLSPPQCADLVTSQPKEIQTALVFGREHAGLTNEELLQCHYHVNIPSNPEYSSLNLSQAVQIIAYELRMRVLSEKSESMNHPEGKMATTDEIEHFYEHLWDVMRTVKFLKPQNPGKVQQRTRRLFNRVQLESMEVSILRGMLSHVQKSLNNKDETHDA